MINVSSDVRGHYSPFAACQFKPKSFFITCCCPPTKIWFRALLSHCIYEALLQLVLGNNLYKICGCIIFTFMIPPPQFFSHTFPAGAYHLRTTHLLLACLSYPLSPALAHKSSLHLGTVSACFLWKLFFSFLFWGWKGTVTTSGMLLVLLTNCSQHLL